MKRNPELINKLLLFIEDLTKPIASERIEIGFPKHDVVYHVALMKDDGLIIANQGIRAPDTNLEFMDVFRLTNAGHDAADKVRSDS
jgi:hypothetical protein